VGTYGIKIAAFQEIRWMDAGQLNIGEYIIFYSGMENSNHFGSGFAVHESLETHIREFNPVSERIAFLRINTIPLNIVLIFIHTPTEVSLDSDKDTFYEDFDRIYDKTLGNVISLGDLNAMCGKEI